MMQKSHTMKHREDGITIREIKGLKFDALHKVRETVAKALGNVPNVDGPRQAEDGYDNQIVEIASQVRAMLADDISDEQIREFCASATVEDIAQGTRGDLANFLDEVKADTLQKARALVILLMAEAKQNKAKAEKESAGKVKKSA